MIQSVSVLNFLNFRYSNFSIFYSVAACDDTSFFFAGCLQDALKEKDHDCIIRLMAGRAEVKFMFSKKATKIDEIFTVDLT